jgi:hypothetical protein
MWRMRWRRSRNAGRRRRGTGRRRVYSSTR